MGMKRYAGAIFDMDGVLFDTERVYQDIWRAIARERGVTLEKSFTRTICGTNGDTMRRIVARFYHTDDPDAVMGEVMRRVREQLSREVPVKAGAPEILRFFRDRGIRIAVASSSARELVVSNLTLTGLLPFFDAIVCGQDVRVGKPAPDIFLYAAGAIGCAPEQCFVFEDSISGVKAGHAAGCDTIMVPDMILPTPEILPLCFRQYDSLTEALEGIRQLMDE